MRLIGLTGGIGTGKSTFAAALREEGVPVIDADALAREAVAPGSPELEQIVAAFGETARAPDGALDRPWVAARVFADSAARQRLEAIVHPAVRRGMTKERDWLTSEGHALAFYEVPLLFEVGLDREVDCTVLVYAAREVSLERLMRRDPLTREQAEARLAAQWPIEEKRSRADMVVMNDGAIEALRTKARILLADLRAGLSRRLPGEPPKSY
jgi:dephospho-CoA kinase